LYLNNFSLLFKKTCLAIILNTNIAETSAEPKNQQRSAIAAEWSEGEGTEGARTRAGDG
jgi:hypothetical protein